MIINLTIKDAGIILTALTRLTDTEIEKFGYSASEIEKLFFRIKTAKDAAIFKRKRTVADTDA